MDNLTIDKAFQDYNKTRELSSHSAFCHAPSLNMYFAQNGEVKVCCHNTTYTLGQYPQNGIQEIWQSEKAKQLRQYMKEYDLNHGCDICSLDIGLRAFHQVQARHFDPRPRHPEYPTMMEFLLSNKCNLECVMCVGEYSSLIRKNREHLPPLEFPYDNTFLEQLEEFIPHLHEARFSGSGEAFLVDLNYQIWEMIIRLNPKCVIMVQTNGTVLTDRVKDFLNRGNFQIGISIDSLTKETYEGIRLNADFDRVMENVRYFANYSAERNKYFMLAMCVMRKNYHELPSFIELCNELKAAAVLHKVWSPEEFALHTLPSSELKTICENLETYDYTPQSALQRQNLDHYKYFVSVIKNWEKEAAQRENRLATTIGLSTIQLSQLVGERMEGHISSKPISDAEKESLRQTFKSKFQNVLLRFDEEEQLAILRILYLENPEQVIEPISKQSEEFLYQNARKSLEAEKAKVLTL